MSVRILLAAALLLLAAAAQTPPAARAPAQVSYPGVSPAGNAVLTKLQRQDDPAFKQVLAQLRDTQSQVQLEVQRPVIDVERIAVLLKKSEALQAQVRSRSADRLIAALRALPAADRGPFLRVIGPRAQGAAAPR